MSAYHLHDYHYFYRTALGDLHVDNSVSLLHA